MRAFNTLDELVAAYTEAFNRSYNYDSQKMFTLDDVRAVCVERLLIMTARMKYGITISQHSYYIRDYGYVLA